MLHPPPAKINTARRSSAGFPPPPCRPPDLTHIKSAKFEIFNWVIEFLTDTVNDEPTREILRLIVDQNFRWLNFADLSDGGKRDVLAALSERLVPHAEEHFPHSPYREGALEVIRELADLARTAPR